MAATVTQRQPEERIMRPTTCKPLLLLTKEVCLPLKWGYLLLLLLTTLIPRPVSAQSTARTALSTDSLPRLVHKNGRHALSVDGAPYLMLGAQVHNSSAWPAMLPKVWPVMAALHVNTVEIPVYWEQFEPQPGRFDYSLTDTLLAQARTHNVRLILLWFGTWKNGSAHYMPEWMKRQPQLYPNVTGKDGKPIDSPSPHAPATLAADIKAFSAFMAHLKAVDRQHTVIMVQVENEPGMWGGIRDFSPAAQRLFAAPVPAQLLKALGKPAGSAGWRDTFGDNADEFFHAWSVGYFIGQVAAAGKAIYPLPLYVNAALRDPITFTRPPAYESGGPTDNVLDIWKAAAPAVDLLAPDIYMNEDSRYLRVLEHYNRPDNALLVPETGNQAGNARYFYAALGNGAIGFSPFGLDYANYAAAPLGTPALSAEVLDAFALNYRAFEPMTREVAQLNFEGKLQAVTESPQPAVPASPTVTSPQTPGPKIQPQVLKFGDWEATVAYGPREGIGANPQPIGRAMVAQLGPDEFLVTGAFARVNFRTAGAASGKAWQFMRVEEGQYQNGLFKPTRIWNGDETDWGLRFTSAPQVVRVSLYTR